MTKVSSVTTKSNILDEDSSIRSDIHEEDDGELTIFDDLYYCDEESFEIEDVLINMYDNNLCIQNLVQIATLNILNPSESKSHWLIMIPLDCSISFSPLRF